MATIGPKEAQRRAQREAKTTRRPKELSAATTTRAIVAAVDGPKKVEPPAMPAEESSVVKKAKKKPAPKAKAKPPKIVKAGVDRSPLTVGTFITRDGGCSMADLEKEFKMDAHPLRSKIHAAKHKLGFTIEYDAKTKLYSGYTPAGGAA